MPPSTGSPSKPQIAVAATRAFPDLGGIEAHLDNVLPRLARGGIGDLTLVVTDVSGTLPTHGERHGVPIRRFRAFPRNRDWYLSPGLFVHLLRGRYDLIHVQGINALVPPTAMVAAVLSGTPFVVTFHSGGANTDLRRRLRSSQWRVLGPLLRRAHALIAVSRSEADVFEAVVRDRAIPVVPNGSFDVAPPEDVQPDPNLVVSVGRLERYKGHHRLIEALPYLRRSRPDARLRILGTGPYEDDLRRIAVENGVDRQVEITSVPPLDRARMAAELAGAGAVALLSDYEAHPVVVIEALSLGRPVVARDNSGTSAYIRDGLVDGVEDQPSPSDVAAAVDRALGRGSRPIPPLPTWDEHANALGAVFRDALDRAHRARRP